MRVEGLERVSSPSPSSVSPKHLLTSVLHFQGGGKIKLLERGAYRDAGVDISLISHPGVSPDSALMRTTAYSSFKVEYHGKEAHAAAAPWEGINALDGLITACLFGSSASKNKSLIL